MPIKICLFQKGHYNRVADICRNGGVRVFLAYVYCLWCFIALYGTYHDFEFTAISRI